MPDNLNRSDIHIDFKDVYDQTITDHVVIKIYNTRLQSEKQSFPVDFQGTPVTLSGVVAFPTGHARMVIQPKRYRFKQRFINVEAEGNNFTEYFFVDPDQAQPRSITFVDLSQKSYSGELLRILGNSGIDQAVWDGLDPRNRATILNLSAKMSRETVADKRTLITFVDRLDRTWLDSKHRERVYARVQGDLLDALRSNPEVYFSAPGGMHYFPSNDKWEPVDSPDSFKTLRDSAGNIQLTFARNGAGELLADIDIDDHKGLKHAADVLKHRFTGKETDPYDIHEILRFSQKLDAEYRLI